jgi:MHS family metabolite:H+ symporter-like MFS transporter
MAQQPGPGAESERPLYRAAWASALGSALEYYDFALYSLYSALIFGDLFFPRANPAAASMAAFGTYFLGFLARPVGGILFGALGDRIGRRTVLAATICLMGLASTLIGCLPTYAQVGVWAPAMLVALRVLQGLGAGAEQAGASVLMAEYAPPARRGFFAALPYVGVQMGAISAPLIVFGLSFSVGLEPTGWLWRVPFLISVAIVGVALWIRLRLRETPTFTRLQERHQVSRRPLRDLLRTSRPQVLVGIGLRMSEVGGSSLYQALAISYMVKVSHWSSTQGALMLLLAAVLSAPVVLAAGALTDRFGRIPVYRAINILQLVAAAPAWWVFSQGQFWPSAAALCVVLGLGTWGLFGSQAAMLPEFFGARHRYIGVAVVREFSAPLAGGTAPLIGAAMIAWSAVHLGSERAAWAPIAAYAVLLPVITLAATFFAPLATGRDLNALEDAPLNRAWRRP